MPRFCASRSSFLPSRSHLIPTRSFRNMDPNATPAHKLNKKPSFLKRVKTKLSRGKTLPTKPSSSAYAPLGQDDAGATASGSRTQLRHAKSTPTIRPGKPAPPVPPLPPMPVPTPFTELSPEGRVRRAEALRACGLLEQSKAHAQVLPPRLQDWVFPSDLDSKKKLALSQVRSVCFVCSVLSTARADAIRQSCRSTSRKPKRRPGAPRPRRRAARQAARSRPSRRPRRTPRRPPRLRRRASRGRTGSRRWRCRRRSGSGTAGASWATSRGLRTRRASAWRRSRS